MRGRRRRRLEKPIAKVRHFVPAGLRGSVRPVSQIQTPGALLGPGVGPNAAAAVGGGRAVAGAELGHALAGAETRSTRAFPEQERRQLY